VAQKFHFAILRIEVTRASRGLSAIAELLVFIARMYTAQRAVIISSFDELCLLTFGPVTPGVQNCCCCCCSRNYMLMRISCSVCDVKEQFIGCASRRMNVYPQTWPLCLCLFV